jgi:hypothetical protein
LKIIFPFLVLRLGEGARLEGPRHRLSNVLQLMRYGCRWSEEDFGKFPITVRVAAVSASKVGRSRLCEILWRAYALKKPHPGSVVCQREVDKLRENPGKDKV